MNRVLTQRYYVYHQDPVLQWHKLEVRELNRWPYHPVLLQRRSIALLQLLPRIRALHKRHGREEHEQVRAGEDGLISQDAGDNGRIGSVLDDDVLLQEAKPFCGGGTEDSTSIEGHATCAGEFVVGETSLFDELLGHGVAGCEEDRGGDGLCEDRGGGELGLVPEKALSDYAVVGHHPVVVIPAQHNEDSVLALSLLVVSSRATDRRC